MRKGKQRRVKDVRIWADMAGDNALEKRLNSFLTHHFILTHDVPADECLAEARKVIEMVKEFMPAETTPSPEVR